MALTFGAGGLQSVDPLAAFRKKKEKRPISQGGTKPEITTPEIFRDVKTGKPTGVTLPGGKTLLGLNKEEISKMLARRQLPAGTIGAKEAAAGRREALAGEEAIGQIGLTPEQMAGLEGLGIPENIRSALAGFGAEAAAGAGAGAIGGAIAGGVPTGGALAIPGAIVGAIAGLGTVALKNIKAEAKEDTTARGKEFRIIRSNMRILISEVNAGRMTPDFAISRYNAQLAEMQRIQRQLKELTSTNLKDFLSDGSDQMAQINVWMDIERPNIEAALQGAVIRPDPTKSLTDDQIDELLSEGDIE